MRRLRRNDEGSAAIEAAFLLPVFLTVLIGVFEFSSFLWVRNTIQFAAEEGARYAMANTTATVTDVTNATRSRLGQLEAAKLTVSVTQEAADGVTYVVVTTRYDWPSAAFSPLFPDDLRTAEGRARMPLVQ